MQIFFFYCYSGIFTVATVACALSSARGEGFDNFICTTDCLSVVQRVNSPGKDRSAYGSVIEDIKRLLSSFQSSSITHVYR